jgi:excisionase family DNA binding protein
MVDEAILIQPQDATALAEVSQLLQQGSATLEGPQGERATLPAPLYRLLKDIVRGLEDGRSFVLMLQDQQLTTQRAAELLGMSRPYFIRLLDAGELPHRLVGRHRRVALRDVLAFAKRQTEMRAALSQMSRDAFEAGLYDRHTGVQEGQSDG